MNFELSDKQIKQLSQALSIDDVISCIKKDYQSYITFLNQELKDNEITEEEYKREISIIKQFKEGKEF